MNDQSSSLSPEALRMIVIATIVITLVGGLDALLGAIGITAVVLFLAGWNLARTRSAAQSLARYVVANRARP